jgi:catechol 2,3-dioxygenase
VTAPAVTGLAATTTLGAVHLVVSDLDRSLPFYEHVIGLRVHRREAGTAALGTGGDDVLVLREEPGARPAGRHAGLYHVALLFAVRAELGRAALRLAATRAPIQGASDHGTHEAIYLADPDGNGLELAWDRARELWPSYQEMTGHGPEPLDIPDLLSTVAGETPTPHAAPGLRVGHVHLHVGDTAPATTFYRDGLGFDVMADLGSAVFVSAGGYHHHVGFNVWRGQRVPPAPAGVVGLDHWTLLVDGDEELARLRERLAAIGAPVEDGGDHLLARDPSGIAVVARAA